MLGYSHFVHSMTCKWGRAVVLQVWSVTSITQKFLEKHKVEPHRIRNSGGLSGPAGHDVTSKSCKGMPSRLRSENHEAKSLALWCWRCSLHRQVHRRQGVTSPSAQVAFSLPWNAMKSFAICLRSSALKRGHRPQSVVTILSIIPWLWSTSIITYTTQTNDVYQGPVHTLLFFSSLKTLLKSSEIRSFDFFSILW